MNWWYLLSTALGALGAALGAAVFLIGISLISFWLLDRRRR